MGKLATTLATGAVALGLSTSPATADTVKQELDTVVCKTKTACDLLSQFIQTQIDGLKSKGFKNLSKEEIVQFFTLK